MLNPLRRLVRGLVTTDPVSSRVLLIRALDRRFDFLRYPTKVRLGSIDRPHYGYGLLQAASLARKLGHSQIAAIEFGVAGGSGLLALERHAMLVKKETGVDIIIFGFDTGAGMPPPIDYRDLPYLWQAGYFRMDAGELRRRLRSSELVLGNVEDTVRAFCQRDTVPPIGFVAFDLDYYSSTLAALAILDARDEFLLPRVVCYFDDIAGDVDCAYNEFTGELLAIKEFNATRTRTKIAPVHGLRFTGRNLPSAWHEQIFVAHIFLHSDYARPICDVTSLPLD